MTPAAGGDATLGAPLLWDARHPAWLSTPQPEDLDAEEKRSFEYDISSLALGFVPFPYTAGYSHTMDSPAARRFSQSAEERVGLLSAHRDSVAKAQQYGTIFDDAEREGLLREDGTVGGPVMPRDAMHFGHRESAAGRSGCLAVRELAVVLSAHAL